MIHLTDDAKRARETIASRYEHLKNTPSDIFEHLPTLYEYSKQCCTVVEMGVRGIVSTWALLHGLVNSDSYHKHLISVDIENVPNIMHVCKIAGDVGIDMKFLQEDSATCNIPEDTDLLFIDTWHIYGHLKRELEAHRTKVKKFIIMHDTEVDGIRGECLRFNMSLLEMHQAAQKCGYPVEELQKGLQPAIDEFLEAHPEWIVDKVYTNNSGLTILKRA